MIEENMNFQELYIRLDALCKDCFNSQEGVSEYIRQMEKDMFEGERIVLDWENIYRELKHIRWKRNQLAHEVGALNSNIIEEDEILFVSNFYNKIINTEDPLSELRKHRQSKNQAATTKVKVSNSANTQLIITKKEPNVLSKLANKIKNFFK